MHHGGWAASAPTLPISGTDLNLGGQAASVPALLPLDSRPPTWILDIHLRGGDYLFYHSPTLGKSPIFWT